MRFTNSVGAKFIDDTKFVIVEIWYAFCNKTADNKSILLVEDLNDTYSDRRR